MKPPKLQPWDALTLAAALTERASGGQGDARADLRTVITILRRELAGLESVAREAGVRL